MTTSTAAATLPTVQGVSLTTTRATKVANQSFNSDMFLNLLVTQLKNQDPSSPMDSSQMVQQTSALASMEQLTALNTSATSSYSLQQRIEASNVLGKQVTWSADGATKSGTVSAVAFGTDGPTLTVGSTTLKLADVTGVATTGTSTATSTASAPATSTAA